MDKMRRGQEGGSGRAGDDDDHGEDDVDGRPASQPAERDFTVVYQVLRGMRRAGATEEAKTRTDFAPPLDIQHHTYTYTYTYTRRTVIQRS